MIFPWPWARSKSRAKNNTAAIGSTPASTPALKARSHIMPRPVIRWVGEGRIALRGFDFETDGAAICNFQEETYTLNFPDFQYTAAFANAFRYDLRRASLDPNHGIFVLDDGRETPPGKSGNIAGFLWVVITQNTWSLERYGYINNLYIAPERRGTGLGRELMKYADEFFRARGIRRVRLTVTQSNESAVALYRACGYDVDRWEMRKDL
jgi:ribosomal protein S18 acetylase RimI-like enzyme